MVNIISVERKQSPYEDFARKVTNYLHDLLEKGEDINYILYKPGQSIDKYVVKQIPLLREKYPGSQIKVVQYRSNKEPDNLLGYPEAAIDNVQLFSSEEFNTLESEEDNNILGPALKKADIIFALTKQEFFLTTYYRFYRYSDKKSKFNFKVVSVANDPIQEESEQLLAALPTTERLFIEQICDQSKVFRSLNKKFLNDTFRDHVKYTLLLQRAGFSLYGLRENRREADPKRVLLLQSDHFCDKPLGDILHNALEAFFREEKAIDFIFGPCMTSMAEEAAHMIAELKEKYPRCEITLVRTLDPCDLERHHRAHFRTGYYLIQGKETQEAVLSALEECTAPIPAEYPSKIALCPLAQGKTYYSYLYESRKSFDSGYAEDVQNLFLKTDLAMIYHYPNSADMICRILRCGLKKDSAEIVSLYDPKVYETINNRIAQLRPKNREIYVEFCAKIPAKQIAASLGWTYQKVYCVVDELLEKIENQIPDVFRIGDPDEIRESCIMGLQSRVADFSPLVWTHAAEWLKRIDYNEDRFSLAALMEDEEIRALCYLTRRHVKELLRQILVDDLGVAPDAWSGEQNMKLLEGIDIKAEAKFYITADEFAKLYRTVQRRCESVPFRYNAEDVFIGFQKALTVQAVWDGIRPLPPKEGIMSLPCSFLGETTEEVTKKLVKNNIAPLHTHEDMKRAMISLWETFGRLELLYGSGVAYRLSRGDTSDFEKLDVDERVYYEKLAKVLYPQKIFRTAH